MGGLVKMFEKDVIERRLENQARVVNEYQPVPSNSGCSSTNEVSAYYFSPEELNVFRAFVEHTNEKCKERMAKEKVIVYKIEKRNEREAAVILAGYMTKAGASELGVAITGGELLDLDAVYIGILLFDDYLFISEKALSRGLRKFGSSAGLLTVIEYLFKEKRAAYEAALQRAA